MIPTPFPNAPEANALSLISLNGTTSPSAIFPIQTCFNPWLLSNASTNSFSSSSSSDSSLGMPIPYATAVAPTKPTTTLIIIQIKLLVPPAR